METCIHIFFECPFAKALWAATCWGLSVDPPSINTSTDITLLIMEPPTSPILVQDQWTVSLNMALVINEIWRSRNLKQFYNVNVDILSAKQSIHSRFLEIVKAFTPDMSTPKEHVTYRWNPPPQGWIKLNVDAALNNYRSAFAVVTRDQLGEVLFLWGKIHLACPPAQAEAEALHWAVQQAIKEGWKKIF
nr:uncharacterized protein LOC112018428 [Quercus suber]